MLNLKKDTADYQCKIENAYSQKTSSAQVLVLGKNEVTSINYTFYTS